MASSAGSYLVLNQTAGVDETLLRVYALPPSWPLPAAAARRDASGVAARAAAERLDVVRAAGG